MAVKHQAREEMRERTVHLERRILRVERQIMRVRTSHRGRPTAGTYFP